MTGAQDGYVPLVTREQQDDLGPVLGLVMFILGPHWADQVMKAYRLGRVHEREAIGHYHESRGYCCVAASEGGLCCVDEWLGA